MNKLLTGALALIVTAQVAHAAEKLTSAEFVARASEAGMAEVEKGKLAAQKASAPEVRAYGQRMVTDHTRSGGELDQIASRKGLAPTRTLGPKHSKALEELRGKSGAQFDAAFGQQMVADHEEAVALFTSAEKLGDEELAGFASRTLPTLRDHQQQAGHLGAKH